MLQFTKVDDSIYTLNLKRNSNSLFYIQSLDNDDAKQFNYITECSDPTCVYTRDKTVVRDKFEEKIVNFCQKKTNLKFLFYGSFLLYQELKIILLLADQVSEIHFTDYAYKDMLTNNNRYILAFNEFMEYIHREKINIRVYIHTDPDKIYKSTILRRRFDIVCGIDIDYTKGNINNRPIMKKIAEHVLKIDGQMYLSQHSLDQVDLCCYEISSKGIIQLIRTEDYVKKKYYNKYWCQNLVQKIRFAHSFVGIFCVMLMIKKSPIISIAGGSYYIVDIVNKYLLDNKPYNFDRQIKNFAEVIRLKSN